MGMNGRISSWLSHIMKYKYAVLILLIGIVLMVVPFGEANKTETEHMVTKIPTVENSLEDRLEQILSYVKGAGEVRVVLTEATGQEFIYQTDESISKGKDTESITKDVITITDANRNQTCVIKQKNPATYSGAIIVCTGADDPVIKLEIVCAVSKVTGLGADKISVLKMK